MSVRSLTEIQRRTPEAVLAGLRAQSLTESSEAGRRLLREAADFGIDLRDYLTLAIDPRLSDNAKKYADGNGNFLNGYETALAVLNLPVRNDFESGIVLQAASETFQTYPGTRAMFPPVIDDLLKWAVRQDQFEQVAPMLANSRTVSGVEMVSTVVNDDSKDRETNTVPELSRIPVRSIRTSETSVRFYKHGSGLRTSYEFNRRASLDILTPYAARIQRELELSKVKAALSLLINGDGVSLAAAETDQSSLNDAVIGNATNGVLAYKHLLKWLVNRAKAGTPVDSVVGNWDAYIQWLFLFTPTINANVSAAQAVQQVGGVSLKAPSVLNGAVNFSIASAAPANKLVGYSKSDTLEELIEANSQISETERMIQNQAIVYYKTENTGYRLVYGDTREVLDFGA